MGKVTTLLYNKGYSSSAGIVIALVRTVSSQGERQLF